MQSPEPPAFATSLLPRLAVTLAAGAVTSALALALVFVVTQHGTNLMLWHVYLVVPLGPALVGALASLGFAWGARWMGLRVSGAVLAATAALLLAAFFVGQYLAFRVEYPQGVVDPQGVPLSFWGYLDFMTRATHFAGKPELGLWGYGFRALGLLGFLAGGLYPPMAWLAGRPHCERCNRFHRTTVVAHLPAEQQEAVDAVLASLGDGRQLAARLNAVAPRESWPTTAQLPARLLFRFSRCTSCDEGLLLWEELGGLPAQERGLERGRQPLAPERVREFVAVWNAPG